MVKELIAAGLGFVVLAVTLMIGGAMISKTQNVTAGIVSNTTLINQLESDTGNALTTMTGLLPIVALALVGGLAIFYLLGFMGGGQHV
jgi:hypothetical protein